MDDKELAPARFCRRLAKGCGVLLSSLFLLSCDSSQHAELNGYLYFGAGAYLGVINLQTGDATPVASVGDLEIEHLSTFDNNELLISVSSSESMRSGRRILRYDPALNYATEFMLGTGARYLPGSNLIIYDNGNQLLAVPRDEVAGVPTVIHSHDRRASIAVVIVSDVQVLVGFKNEREPVVLRIDATTGISETLDDLARECDLDDAQWMADEAQLLCKKPGAVDDELLYQFVDMQGRVHGALNLPQNKRFRAVAYLAEQRAVVLTETWHGWFDKKVKGAIWIHDLRSGETWRLADNQHLGSSVVYRRWQF